MTASSNARLITVWLTLLAPLLPLSARAQAQTAPPTEEQVEAARALYREARELHKQGRVREALAKALDAYRTAPTPVTALETGELLVEVGRLVEARDVLRSIPLMPVSPRESDKGRDARQQGASLGAQLDMRIPKIAFAGRPVGVDVVLDGHPVAPTDATAWQGVDPGAHVLLVRVDDRPCTTVNLSLSEGEERTIDLHDAAAACRPPTPPPPVPVPPRIPVRAPVVPPAPPAERSASTSTLGSARWIGVAVAGAGAVGLGIGGVLALDAKARYDGVAGECTSRGCNQNGFDVRNSARDQADVATALLVVGASAVLGGGLLWWLAPSPHPRAEAVIGPGSIGVKGAF
ncbi:MAG TPA: hypothetical protein VGL81_17560 [Polyangiaceae bacterium]|jgi:hypothetical protein